MGNSFSQNNVDGFPDNEVVQLLIHGHDCICLRVGFKKWNIIFILCSVVIGTRYAMGSNNIINCKQQLINQLTTENSKQLARINDLLLLATDTKSLENELKSLKTQLKNSGCGKKSLTILPQMFLERRMTQLIEPDVCSHA